MDHQAAAIVDGLLRAAHRLRGRLASELGEFGLTDVRLAVLQIVQDAEPAGCSQTELADRLEQAESSISTLVERMQSDGLLDRLRSRSDRRKRVLILTERGRTRLARGRSRYDAETSALLECFDCHQRETLAELLRRLNAELSQTAAGRDRRVVHAPPAA